MPAAILLSHTSIKIVPQNFKSETDKPLDLGMKNPQHPPFLKSLFAGTLVLIICISETVFCQQLNHKAVCFYYNWYGSVQEDGKNHHWAHEVMKRNDKDSVKGFFPGAKNIGANYYPQAGEYSSANAAVIEKHMQQIALAGIGVVAVTWLGENDYTFKSVPLLLDAAQKHGIKICFQIEPVVRKNALAVKDAVEFLVNRFGKHKGFYRDDKTNRPLFFVYDSYVIDAEEWATVLTAGGKNSMRGKAYDADIIGLWVTNNEQAFFIASGFDGFYTYFANEGFTYGATTANWAGMQQWADANHKIFIPSVGPGYIDTRIRPWNAANTKSREGGAYYDRMFSAAIESKVKWIGITSFNEWHEGTQIEPAVPFSFEGYKYEDYQPLPPDYYLKRTRYWLEKFSNP